MSRFPVRRIVVTSTVLVVIVGLSALVTVALVALKVG
jgi:hypothetical protein